MEIPTQASTAISGTLPIRSAKPRQVDVQDATNDQVREATQIAMMNPQIKFIDALTAVVGDKKKRTRRKRPKSKRGNDKPTGFEEYYADGPITPKEHAEMQEVYDPNLPFIDRIEEAIRRFQYRRRIETFRLNLLNKYLQYGGINLEAGLSRRANNEDMKHMERDQIMQARAQAEMEKERETLEVNFDLVLRGFLGSYFTKHFSPENEAVITWATETIKNFCTYLLQCDVCPEYTENLLEARKTCDLAAKELWMNVQLVRAGPGQFNESCSTLFGGAYFQSSKPSPGSESEKTAHEKKEKARDVVRFAIAGAASFQQARSFQELVIQNKLSAKKIHDIDGFEALEVIEPDAQAIAFYHGNAPNYTPVGKVKAVSFRDPAQPDIDMSLEERREWDEGKAPKYEFEFLVDEDLLPLLYPGLKVITGVWELGCGLYYFDEVRHTYPTFRAVIANDLVLKWKWPRDLTGEDSKKAIAGSGGAIQWTVDAAPKVIDQQTGEQSDED